MRGEGKGARELAADVVKAHVRGEGDSLTLGTANYGGAWQ